MNGMNLIGIFRVSVENISTNIRTNESFAIRVLHGIIISQLMLQRVQHKPTLLPSFQQCAALIQVSINQKTESNVKCKNEMHLGREGVGRRVYLPFVCSFFSHITAELIVEMLSCIGAGRNTSVVTL